MPSILYLSTGENKSPTRYRALVYFERLQQSGWQTQHYTIQRNFSNKWQILKKAKKADVVVVLRKTFPGPFLYLLRWCSKKLIYDFDDALFVRETGQTCARRYRHFARMVHQCDRVWAGNHYLQNTAATVSNQISYIPTAIELKDYLIPAEKPTNYFDLVWVGSSATKPYLQQALPILEKLAQKYPQLRLKIIADFTLESNYLTILPLAWHYQQQVIDIASSHVGIAPMPDNKWTQGKCALKVIQYMAAGLPVITSPVGVNKEAVLPGKTGFFADTLAEWEYAITQLQNKSLREQFGQLGRQRVQQHYSLDVVFNSIVNDLSQ